MLQRGWRERAENPALVLLQMLLGHPIMARLSVNNAMSGSINWAWAFDPERNMVTLMKYSSLMTLWEYIMPVVFCTYSASIECFQMLILSKLRSGWSPTFWHKFWPCLHRAQMKWFWDLFCCLYFEEYLATMFSSFVSEGKCVCSFADYSVYRMSWFQLG